MARVEGYTADYVDQVVNTLSSQVAQLQITVNGKSTIEDIQNALSALVGTAPGVLDTLGEISDAFQDNPNIIPEMLASIGLRVTTATYNTHLADTAAHGAVATATANTPVRRDAAGKAQVTTPVTADPTTSIVTKGYVDPRFMHVVDAGTNLSTARPTGAPAVHWKFGVGVDPGPNGENVVNGLPGDTFYVANA